MSSAGRKELLCQQDSKEITGIDFIWIDPTDHRRLAVFFVIEPTELERPIDTTETEFTATIRAVENGHQIAIESYAWISRLDASGNPRLTLTIVVEEEGGFQNYVLKLTDQPVDAGSSRLDRFCDQLPFSFKQPCPSPFDCRPVSQCPPTATQDYPIDYLARDFESFRQALIAFASDRYPHWEARVPADFGGMISELFAALGDEFSYIQDRFLREGYLETLTQRRSFAQLARLIDYQLDPGQAASGLVILKLYDGSQRPTGHPANLEEIPAGARVWANQEDGAPIAFEIGENLGQMLAGSPTYSIHTHWTDLPAYLPDSQKPCLPHGSREMYVADGGLLSPPFPADVLATDIHGYWVGRKLLIETRPAEPEAPIRRHIVELDEPIESFEDPLTEAGPLLRLHWRAEDALPFELDQTQAFVSANLLPIRAGFSVAEEFLIGSTTVQRGGPAAVGSTHRPSIHRYSLGLTAEHGLAWQTSRDDSGTVSHEADVVLQQIADVVSNWSVKMDALSFAATDEIATLEHGLWASIAEFDRQGQRMQHWDYASDLGFTLRFGDGEFGRQPTRGDLFRVTYRTGPGVAANVPADTITVLEQPQGYPPPLHEMPSSVMSVQNPRALTNGRDPEDLELARRIAPAAYKALVFRAVRNGDYEQQVERLEWVQRAGAVTRWTGAWQSTFVSADPRGAFDISDRRLAELRARLSAVRQVGRCVIARQPIFVAVDLRIAICVSEGFAFGDVLRRILRSLVPSYGSAAYLGPDNFSFGDPLSRPALEAAIASVQGVKAVMEMQYRIRGRTDWQAFTASEIPIADNRILKVKNDPNRPGEGTIRIYDTFIPKREVA